MTLRDDIRDYFEREARRMPAPSGLRSQVTSRAITPKAGATETIRWAAVVAAMLAAAIVIGLVATGAFKQSRGIPVGQPIPVTPGAHGFVFDVSFANSSDGWALLGLPGAGSAQYYVEATHDGGATWLTPVAVGHRYNNSAVAGQPRHIHFVDRDDGFIYGGPFAFATHDGGRSWVDAGLPSDVVAITGQEGITWGVTADCASPNCPYSVHVSPDGGKSWLKSAPLPVVPRGAVSFGVTGLLVTDVSSSDIVVTTDGGTTWNKISGPCPAGTAISGAVTADGREIWEVCSPLPPNDSLHQAVPISSVFVSEDAGKSWQRRAGTPAGIGVEIVLSPAAGTALVATDTSLMQISHDAGRTWTQCVTDPAHPQMQSASYSADGSIAVAVDRAYTVWISRDGGNSWVRTVGQP